MATKGLKYPVYAIYSEADGERVYTNGAVAGKAITASVSYIKSGEKLYGDDALQETDQTVLGGTITMGTTDLTTEIRAILLGHTTVAEPYVGFVGAGTDEAPFVGFGFYGVKTGGIFVTFWYNKVQFSEPNDELETKRDRVAFRTPTFSGEFGLDIKGEWGEILEWNSEAKAIAYLNGKAGIIPKCQKPVADKASGTYATSATVTLTGKAGETIYYTLNGLTPSEDTGTKYVGAITITKSCALKAIAVKENQLDSDIVTYEYIITA